MTRTRCHRLTATTTTALALIGTVAATAAKLPGLALMAAALAWFSVAAIVRLRPRRVAADQRLPVSWRMETRDGVDYLVATDDQSFTRWTPRGAA